MPGKKRRILKHKERNIYGLLALFTVAIGVLLFGFFKSVSESPLYTPNQDVLTIPPEIVKQLSEKPYSKAQNLQTVRIPILIYHYVEIVKDAKDNMRKSLNTPPFIFEKQIQTLQDDNYTFLFPSEIPEMIHKKREIPKKPVVLSFDDGYRDFYTDVFPIIKKYNVKAVTYVVPGYLDRPNYLLTSQLAEIAQNPNIEIAAHTMHHTWLKGLSQKTMRYEIKESKEALEDLLHISVVSFAYPYGAFDNDVISEVKKAGFTNAVTTVPGIIASEENRFFLYRLRPGQRTGRALLDYLQQKTFTAY